MRLLTHTASRYALLLASLCTQISLAQTGTEDFGPYRVHYSVFNSTQISPEIASQYELQRANDRALVNISVNRADGDATSFGQAAKVSGTATNLTQQQQRLDFQEIDEGRARYYLAQVRHINEEMYNFRITITPKGSETPLELRFSQKLYTE